MFRAQKKPWPMNNTQATLVTPPAQRTRDKAEMVPNVPEKNATKKRGKKEK